jgi:hypothetical protein
MSYQGGRIMKRRVIIQVLSVVLAAASYLSAFQLESEIVKQRSKWESILKKGEIIKHEDIGEGITKPKRIFLKAGDVETSGCWKCCEGIQKGYKENWEYEIAAYKLDLYFGMGMVPPTVERRFRGRRGSLQLWVDLELSDLERYNQKIPIPENRQEHCDKMLYLARAFDSLIGNIDRTQQNIRWTGDWCLILIDHSRSFRTKRLYTDQLIYGQNGLRKTMGFDQLPRGFVQKVKALNKDKVRSIVGEYLSYNEIEAMMMRRKLLLKDIEELIEEKGEAAVLY